jgi:Pvc16 N-terminal domain
VSNPLAISAVTVSLLELLNTMTKETDPAGPTGFELSYAPPDRADNSSAKLNVYLYRVDTNAALDNSDLPFRDPNGQLVRQPVSALSLRYLVSAYGPSWDQLDAQHLLARAVRILNDTSLLTRAQIRAAMTAWATKWKPINQSDLADAVESVRFSRVPVSDDELSKLWSSFNTAHRISVVYEASAVLVDRKRTTQAGPPVRRPLVHTVPMRRPAIEAVSPQFVRATDKIRIEGRNLNADVVRLRFPNGPYTPQVTDSVGDERIEVRLPAGLLPGVTPVQVLHGVLLGDPPSAHAGFESNPAVTTLIPELLTAPTPPGTPAKLPPPPSAPLPGQPLPSGAFKVTAGSDFNLTVKPAVGRDQQLALLLTALDPSKRAAMGTRVIDFPRRPAGDPETSTTAKFRVPTGFPQGDYLVQVRIDSAESALEPETDPARAAINPYAGPWIRVE